MISIRLPIQLENQLKILSNDEHITKTEIIKNALKEYLTKKSNKKTPYELGKHLFGKYSISDVNLSQNYKIKIKEKLNEKYNY